MFDNIPAEMRAYRNWIVWRFEDTESGRPTKVPYTPSTSKHASSTDPQTWTTYDVAVEAVTKMPDHWNGIGFVLSDIDPYAFIDLDEPKNPNGSPLPQEEYAIRMDHQQKVYNEFNSYAERSPSGKGLHIIVKGSIPNGRKRSSIEIYSTARFMTMTGDVYRNGGIKDCHELLNILWSQMGKGKEASMYYAGLEKALYTDEEIIKTASTAANAEKFHDLYVDGNWHKHNYPSQSEADFALIDILAYYTQNRGQIQRLFLNSKLGQRDKSRAQYRINYMLDRCFDKMLPPIDMEGLRDQVNAVIEKAKAKVQQPPAIQLIENYQQLPQPAELPPDSTYSVPPGLLGEIAQYIYSQSPLPVAEIAVAAAIGLMSGIVGKSYNVSATGLNQYIILVSLTGTGKEAMASGISKLMTEVKKNCPPAGEFIGPGAISSEQALVKYFNHTSSSFVSIFGEFAITLKQMCSDRAPSHLLGVKRMLLDLYNKSGAGDQVQPTIYSEKDKNTNIIYAPAFSILCESSPEIFYEVLDDAMISGGLLPRFTIIENHGDRAVQNEGASLVRPSFDLIQKLSTLCANSLNLIHQKKVVNVKQNAEAAKILKDFAKHCHNNIVGAKEVRRQLWNRAHIKALKLAAVVAVGMHPFEPEINREAALWAIDIIVADVRNMLARFEAGEVGIDNDETKQLVRTAEVIKEYITRPFSEITAYSVHQSLHSERIIPYGYLQKRLSQNSAFRRDKQGATAALKRVITTLLARGDMQEVPKMQLGKEHSVTATCYVITNLKVFGL